MDLPDNAIEARGLFKTYPATRQTPAMAALKGIDLTIPRGSIFGLLGPNGAGKSTFINILAGLTRKTDGERAHLGPRHRRAPARRPRRHRRGASGDRRRRLLHPAGISGGAGRASMASPRASAGPTNCCGRWRLSDKADAYVRQLSGGMKRRLMVAKAMVHNPPVLVLDEPTAGVDVELRRQLWNYVVALNQQGVTIVLTTHYLEEAESLCDTIAIVNRGQVVACEPTTQLLRRLDTRTVVVTPETPLASAPAVGRFETRLRPNGDLAVVFKTAETGVEQVLADVRAAGVPIKDLRTEEPDLEDVFVSLTYAAPDTSPVAA